MTNLEIRLVKKDEYEELMTLMNRAFDFNTYEEKFEHILPKLYFKDNKNMVHYAAFVDGKMVSSVGLYTMFFESIYGTLKVGCVGAVSTHPDYRNNGYFSKVIKKIINYAKRHDFDTLFLGGNRFRYNHFGFENAGRKMIISISQRTRQTLKTSPYKIEKLDKNNSNDIIACLNLYNKQAQHVKRNEYDFFNHVITWNSTPYIVKVDEKIVGYFSVKDDEVLELIFIDKYFDTVLDASLSILAEVTIQLPYSLYSEKLLKKVDSYTVLHNEMHYVINWDKAKKYLGFDETKSDEFNKLSKKEKLRALFGCNEFPTKFCKLDMYIGRCDQG